MRSSLRHMRVHKSRWKLPGLAGLTIQDSKHIIVRVLEFSLNVIYMYEILVKRPVHFVSVTSAQYLMCVAPLFKSKRSPALTS